MRSFRAEMEIFFFLAAFTWEKMRESDGWRLWCILPPTSATSAEHLLMKLQTAVIEVESRWQIEPCLQTAAHVGLLYLRAQYNQRRKDWTPQRWWWMHEKQLSRGFCVLSHHLSSVLRFPQTIWPSGSRDLSWNMRLFISALSINYSLSELS